MTVKTIETLEQWHILKASLDEKEYKIWQWQYRAKHPEGFHMCFWGEGDKLVEVIAHSPEIEAGMVRSLRKM